MYLLAKSLSYLLPDQPPMMTARHRAAAQRHQGGTADAIAPSARLLPLPKYLTVHRIVPYKLKQLARS